MAQLCGREGLSTSRWHAQPAARASLTAPMRARWPSDEESTMPMIYEDARAASPLPIEYALPVLYR